MKKQNSPKPKALPEQPEEIKDLTGMISVRAHEIWVERGQKDGDDVAHWLEAEKEIKERLQSKE